MLFIFLNRNSKFEICLKCLPKLGFARKFGEFSLLDLKFRFNPSNFIDLIVNPFIISIYSSIYYLIRILDLHWKKMDPDPGHFFKIY